MAILWSINLNSFMLTFSFFRISLDTFINVSVWLLSGDFFRVQLMYSAFNWLKSGLLMVVLVLVS
mgnify:CR=1 FL=1